MNTPLFPTGGTAYAVDRTLPLVFFDTLLVHKIAAARANHAIGILGADATRRITHAADILRQTIGSDDTLPTIWQSGCGLEFNRWANQRISETCHKPLLARIDPADVNRNQSTNDTVPTVIHVSLLRACQANLKPASHQLQRQLYAKATMLSDASVMGRTFLRDARVMPLADVFTSWANLLDEHQKWLDQSLDRLTQLPQGGYSLGNGDGIDARFAPAYVEYLNDALRVGCFIDPRPTNAISGIRALAAFSGALASLSAGLEKMAEDIMLLCSGPDHGFGDLLFTETRNDSTTLIGKSNPTQATTLTMACAYSRAMCTMVVDLAARGHLQLYTQFPLTAYALLDSVETLARQINDFASDFIPGLTHRVKELQG